MVIPILGALAIAEGGKRAKSSPLNVQALVGRSGWSQGEQISASIGVKIKIKIKERYFS